MISDIVFFQQQLQEHGNPGTQGLNAKLADIETIESECLHDDTSIVEWTGPEDEILPATHDGPLVRDREFNER